jgi:hypothetical protein
MLQGVRLGSRRSLRGARPLVYCIIHSLPIESWVVDDGAILVRDREPQGLP